MITLLLLLVIGYLLLPSDEGYLVEEFLDLALGNEVIISVTNGTEYIGSLTDYDSEFLRIMYLSEDTAYTRLVSRADILDIALASPIQQTLSNCVDTPLE